MFACQLQLLLEKSLNVCSYVSYHINATILRNCQLLPLKQFILAVRHQLLASTLTAKIENEIAEALFLFFPIVFLCLVFIVKVKNFQIVKFSKSPHLVRLPRAYTRRFRLLITHSNLVHVFPILILFF